MSSGNISATVRLRRRWRLEDVAERMGVTRYTVADPDRDEEGKALEGARSPQQAPRRHPRLDDDF
jgi:transcriptional regulator with XRE-family HTH domain